MSALFRKEAVNNQSQRLTGEVCLAQPFSFTVITILILLILVIAVSYLISASYTHKERVIGYLEPSLGQARIMPIKAGVISTLKVSEGELVRKGDVLASVETLPELVNDIDINSSLQNDLNAALIRHQETIADQRIVSQLQEDKLLVEVNLLNNLVYESSQQQRIIQKRLAIALQQLQEGTALQTKGFISRRQLDELKSNHLLINQQYAAIRSDLVKYQAQLKTTRFDIVQLPLQLAEQETLYQQNIAKVKQQIRSVQLRQNFQIRATRTGRVTNILAKVGERVSSNTPLLTIMPKDAQMEAVLLIPTQAFGFIKLGQITFLRYQAFPYQRFGLFKGRIKQISNAILMGGDVALPVNIKEPVYKVVVTLDHQQVQAYGEQLPLQAGMLLEADIVIDSRSLWHWLFDPLYSLKGSLL